MVSRADKTESNERGIYIHIKWVDHDVGKNRTGRTSYSFTPRSQNQFFWLNCHCVRIKKLRDCEMVGEIKKTGYVFYAVKNKIKKSRKAGSQPQNLIFQVPIKQVI